MKLLRLLLISALCPLLLGPLLPQAAALEEALVQAETDFTSEQELPDTCTETSLGNLCADAARESCSADFALLPAGAMEGTLAHGAVFASDLERIIPQDQSLCTVSISAAQLFGLLETGVSHLVTNQAERIDPERSDWDCFPQVSGFSWTYDVSAPVGERVLSVSREGTELDPADETVQYTLVTTAQLLEGAWGNPLPATPEDAGLTLREALARYCTGRDTLSALPARATVIGTASYPLWDRFPLPALAGICLVVALLAALPRWKGEKHFSFQGKTSH